MGQFDKEVEKKTERLRFRINEIDELRQTVEDKREEISARIREARGDGTENSRVAQLEAMLGEVQHLLKDGWTSVTDSVADKLNHWLDRLPPRTDEDTQDDSKKRSKD